MRKAFLKWKYKRLYLKTKYGFEEYSCGHKTLLVLVLNITMIVKDLIKLQINYLK